MCWSAFAGLCSFLHLAGTGMSPPVRAVCSALQTPPSTHTHTVRENQGQLTLATWCSRQGSFRGMTARLVLDYSLSIVTARSLQAENLYDFQKL